jgi:hypothetical protein
MEHPSGFVGFRVVIAYSDNYHQKYFSTIQAQSQSDSDVYYRYQHLRAQKQELEWQLESLRYQYHRFVTQNHPSTKPERGLGVHGLTASFYLDRRKKWQAALTVSLDRSEGSKRKPSKRFTFRTRPFSEVWELAVNFWAIEHGIKDQDRDRVLNSPPEPDQLKRLRRHMNDHGNVDIPVEALSPVFAEQRERMAFARSLQKAEKAELIKGLVKRPDDQLVADMTAWFEIEQETTV